MTKRRRATEGDLRRLSACTLPSGRQDTRADLDEVGVAFDEAAIEQDEHCNALELDVDLGLSRERSGLLDRDAVERVDMQAGDRFDAIRDLFDLDAALSREHAEVALGSPVEREACSTLGDVRRLFHPDAGRYDFDIEAEDVGFQCNTVFRVNASLTPPALPRPPTWTWALIVTGYPIESAASTASSTVSQIDPVEVGMPKRAKYCLP